MRDQHNSNNENQDDFNWDWDKTPDGVLNKLHEVIQNIPSGLNDSVFLAIDATHSSKNKVHLAKQVIQFFLKEYMPKLKEIDNLLSEISDNAEKVSHHFNHADVFPILKIFNRIERLGARTRSQYYSYIIKCLESHKLPTNGLDLNCYDPTELADLDFTSIIDIIHKYHCGIEKTGIKEELDILLSNLETYLDIAGVSPKKPDQETQVESPKLNETEKEIIKALSTKYPLIGEQIACTTEHPYDSNLKQHLANLVRRKILGNNRKSPKGYFIEPAYQYLTESIFPKL